MREEQLCTDISNLLLQHADLVNNLFIGVFSKIGSIFRKRHLLGDDFKDVAIEMLCNFKHT